MPSSRPVFKQLSSQIDCGRKPLLATRKLSLVSASRFWFTTTTSTTSSASGAGTFKKTARNSDEPHHQYYHTITAASSPSPSAAATPSSTLVTHPGSAGSSRFQKSSVTPNERSPSEAVFKLQDLFSNTAAAPMMGGDHSNDSSVCSISGLKGTAEGLPTEQKIVNTEAPAAARVPVAAAFAVAGGPTSSSSSSLFQMFLSATKKEASTTTSRDSLLSTSPPQPRNTSKSSLNVLKTPQHRSSPNLQLLHRNHRPVLLHEQEEQELQQQSMEVGTEADELYCWDQTCSAELTQAKPTPSWLVDPAVAICAEEAKMQYASFLFNLGLNIKFCEVINRLVVAPPMEEAMLLPPRLAMFQQLINDCFMLGLVLVHCSNCGHPGNAYVSCANCRKPALHCAVCSIPVRGLAAACPSCRHGGHLDHIERWFQDCSRCPMPGCDCSLCCW